MLVLNQSYEPLMVINAKRAIILMIKEKVKMLEKYSESISSARESFDLPSVIRLNIYVHLKYKDIILNRRNILKRDHFTCQYCNKSKSPLTLDHIIPKNRGGEDTWENLVCACHRCNNRKGSRTPEQAQLPLRRKPRSPHNVTFIRYLIGIPDERWRPYLFMEASD